MGQRFDVFVATPKEEKLSCTFIAIIDNETIKETVEIETHSMYPLHKMSWINVLELLNKQECKKFGPYIHW